MTSFGPAEPAVWLTKRWAGHLDVLLGPFHTPLACRFAGTVSPTATRTRNEEMRSPFFSQFGQKCCRKAGDFASTSSHWVVPPESACPQHTAGGFRLRGLITLKAGAAGGAGGAGGAAGGSGRSGRPRARAISSMLVGVAWEGRRRAPARRRKWGSPRRAAAASGDPPPRRPSEAAFL